MNKRWQPWLGLALLLGGPVTTSAEQALPVLHTRLHELCEPAPECETIGRLRLRGALVLPSLKHNGVTLAGLSGLAWDEDEGILHAVSDNGAIFGLKPEFRDGRLVNAQLTYAAPLIDPLNRKPVRWQRSDSEGLDALNTRNGKKGDTELVISFEGDPRIARYRPDGSFIADIKLPSPLDDKRSYRYNRMLESVCAHPREGILTAPEEPLNGDTAVHLYRVSDGRRWQLPKLRGGLSAIECLPDGSVLLLEREFQLALLRWRITLWKTPLPVNLPAGAVLETEQLATLDTLQGLRIDNLEGLARHQGQRYFMVSDNNNNLLQQTLLVYFEITGHP